MNDRVTIDIQDGVADVRLVRTDKMNALDDAMFSALIEAGERLKTEAGLRAVVLSGEGRAFCAGLDMGNFGKMASGERKGGSGLVDTDRTAGGSNRAQHAVMVWREIPVPVIAAVQGMAFGGGCELTLACDLVILEAHATLTFREAAMGLSTGWGGGTRLIERVGPMHAARALFLGESIRADDALSMGLASEVVAQGRSVEEALGWVHRIERFPRAAIAGIKRMLRDVRQERRAGAFEREADVFASLWGKPDHLAAMEAFFARRG